LPRLHFSTTAELESGSVTSVPVSPRACSAVVLAMNAYRGRFTRAHLQAIRERHGHALLETCLLVLVVALETHEAVYVAFSS
jgi:hypothetical protein